ncbi:uncharacterized protein LOC143180058 [Calliopsis andreniformis]|uniref:uncharacterized protein LOC143180058 n=1 Tax=Calliopsis andreniformis TaxID=337506 RepID=UPI003FCC8FB6
METDWANSSSIKFNIETMTNKAKLSNLWSNLILGVYVIAVVVYSGVFIEIVYELDKDEIDPKSPELLLKMKIPIESFETPIYQCLFLGQLFQLSSVAFAIALLNSFFLILYKYIIRNIRTTSLPDLIDTLSLAAAFSLTSIKLITVWKKHSALRYLLTTMQEDCWKYAITDKTNVMSKAGYLSYRLTTMVFLVYPLSVVFYGIGFMYKPTNHSTPRELLIKMDLPFEVTATPMYELVTTTQFVHQLLVASTFGIFSALLLMVLFRLYFSLIWNSKLTLRPPFQELLVLAMDNNVGKMWGTKASISILHVGCQVDIMCKALLDISNKSKNRLRFFIIRHQEIILFTQKIEEIFTYVALSQLVSNTIITCCLGFLMVTSVGKEDGVAIIIRSIIFYVSICVEVFIFCFAGEYLTIKSEMIGFTAYKMLWYDLRPSESRLIVLLLLRSQKGLPLTFGKFSQLSLESFTSVMKASASYVSMLLAVT